MAAAEKKPGFNTFAVGASALAALIVVWVLAQFLQGGFLAARALEYETKVMTPVDEARRDYQGQQQARLDEGYRWINKEQGVVGVPLERAIELVVAEDGGR